ncbi:MAG: hypothetical protein HY898_00580 [Deltaproteobacteria bacterium]|nr:hypothetical protein [Deltaproteobacteria bacterium]
MRCGAWFAALAVAAGMIGCGSEDSTTANDVVQSVDGRSAVDTLIGVFVVKGKSSDPLVDASYVDYRQISRVKLQVDGEPWGTFSFDGGELAAAGSQDGWVLHSTRSEALLVATLGTEGERTDDPLDSVEEWVALLHKHLAPGGHVALVEDVVLKKTDGTFVTAQPRLLVPFTIAQGDRSALLGDVVVEIDPAGGAR